MMRSQVFKGANVFMSRNLVPPEVFDALLDALKHNGAEIFLCCDPSRNGSNDFHEKFEDLRSKCCNLLGPQCVLYCAKENKPLPKQSFTCCLAMEGLKVLVSGFQMDEKSKIGKLVTAMGGVLHTKASADVNFVIVKNVLAAKYKWAFNIQKKPIVTIQWLYQCWAEHRVVPQELYRVPPFSGLTICVTRIPADERKEIERLIIQNGGKYSAELTKNCTHLIADTAEGDKFKVARKWGHIHIVTRKWFDQSIARRACLSEDSYPVQDGYTVKGLRASLGQNTRENIRNSIATSQSVASESDPSALPFARVRDFDLEASVSQHVSSMLADHPSAFLKEGDGEARTLQPSDEANADSHVANDSQSEDNDLYLSECRIYIIGFEASELRKLVSLVRRGGGSRYMLPNDKLTHIVVGTPSETEKKQARSFVASGVIQVVRASWLEDCDSRRKEVPVSGRHIAYDLLLPKDSMHSIQGARGGMTSVAQSKNSFDQQSIGMDHSLASANAATGLSSWPGMNTAEKPRFSMKGERAEEATIRSSIQKKSLLTVSNGNSKGWQKLQNEPTVQNLEERKSSVFKRKRFCFSDSFPEDRRAEIVQWVKQGGGEVGNSAVNHNVHFTIECHGVISRSANVPQPTYVSSHWVRSCLEEGCLLDVGSHILYTPLTCQTPLPGFQNFRFCVSQYEEKDRLLLKNLCFVLGAKFVEKLTRKVTHLLCKFAVGPKYEAACKWGIHSVTSEWVYECIRQNQVVSLAPFSPKEVSSQDEEARHCLASQFPMNSMKNNSGDIHSQLTSQSERQRSSSSHTLRNEDRCIDIEKNDVFGDNGRPLSCNPKKAKLIEDSYQENTLSSRELLGDLRSNVKSNAETSSKGAAEVAPVVPDVAAAIEDLLEQTSKIQDQKSPGSMSSDRNLLSSNCTGTNQEIAVPNSVTGLSTHWLNLTLRKDNDADIPSENATLATCGGSSEPQTDSQIVGYEEDLSGRQMLIDRVRTRGSLA